MSRRRYAKDAKCPTTGKRQYTERGAQLALAHIDANVPRPDDYKETRHYTCEFCGAHHLTHKPDNRLIQREVAA